MVSLIYQGLVRISPNLEPIGDMASSWTVNGKDYEFKIPAKTYFSDGSLLQCQDILESIMAYQSSKSPFRGVFNKIQNPLCKYNDKNIQLSFSLPEASAKFLIADLPVLKIFKKTLGSGPFVISKNTPAESVLKPNPHYFKPQAYQLHIFYLKDDFARFLKVYNGEIDIAPNSIPFEKVNSFKGKAYKILETPSLSTSYLLLNHKNALIKNLNFRKKLYRSINIPDLVINRFDNHVSLAKSLLSPEHPFYSKDLNSIEHTPLIENHPKKLLTLKTSNSRQSIETGKIIAQSLREKGIPVRLQSFEWGTFYRDVKSGNYDLALMKWVGVIDPDQYNIAFHSSEFPPGRNRGYYKNKALDLMLNQGRKALDFKKRKKLYDQAQNKVYQDLAILPLWHENQIHIVHPRINGYKVNPMGDFFSFLNLQIKESTNAK